MPLNITNPEINLPGGNGIYIGKDAKNLTITDPNISNCEGHGIMVSANSDALISSPNISNVGKDGIHIFSEEDLIKKLDLPETIDLKQLRELLLLLREIPEEKRLKAIQESFLGLSGLNNLTGIANNILQIIPHLPQF